MNIKVSILSPSDEPAWQDYVNSHPDSTIYHILEWRDILYNEYRFEPVYLIAKETNPSLSHPHLSLIPEGKETILLPPLQGKGWGGDGVFSEQSKVIGVLPMFLVKNLRGRRLISLPFSIYGGPLGDTGEVVSALIEKSVEIVRDGAVSSLEIRPHKVIGDDIGLVSSEWGVGTNIDLSIGIDALWKGLTDRNDVNRAVREGLVFSISDGETLDRFYRLQLMTRKKLGLPTPSMRYYSSFFKRVQGSVKLGMVEKEGLSIAGGLFFTFKSTITYALGSSDQRYLSSRPNDFLIWEMMKWGSENGFKVFDLGPTPYSDKGLMHFKAKWGVRRVSVNKYIFPCHNKGHKTVNKMASNLFEVLPVSLARHIGHHVIRMMG